MLSGNIVSYYIYLLRYSLDVYWYEVFYGFFYQRPHYISYIGAPWDYVQRIIQLPKIIKIQISVNTRCKLGHKSSPLNTNQGIHVQVYKTV